MMMLMMKTMQLYKMAIWWLAAWLTLASCQTFAADQAAAGGDGVPSRQALGVGTASEHQMLAPNARAPATPATLDDKELARLVRLNELLGAISASLHAQPGLRVAPGAYGPRASSRNYLAGLIAGDETAAAAASSSSSSSSANSRSHPHSHHARYHSADGQAAATVARPMPMAQPLAVSGRAAHNQLVVGLPAWIDVGGGGGGVALTPTNEQISLDDDNDAGGDAVDGSDELAERRRQQQQQQRMRIAAPGSAEVATPVRAHSLSLLRNARKREDRSRWMNLRGMWGKRAAVGPAEEADLVDKFKNLIESERQRRQRRQRHSGMVAASGGGGGGLDEASGRVRENDDSDDGQADGDNQQRRLSAERVPANPIGLDGTNVDEREGNDRNGDDDDDDRQGLSGQQKTAPFYVM